MDGQWLPRHKPEQALRLQKKKSLRNVKALRTSYVTTHINEAQPRQGYLRITLQKQS